MSKTIKLLRGTKERWESLNPILEDGEPGVEIGSNVKIKIGDGIKTWNELNYIRYDDDSLNTFIANYISKNSDDFTTNYNKIGIDNIVCNSTQYPITYQNSIGNNRSDRYYKNFLDNFSEYTNFLFDIHYDNGTSYTELQFNSTDEIITFLNENTPNNSSWITSKYLIECYAKQKTDVGNINKIYGLNLFYSVLKGKKGYKKKYKTVYDSLYLNSSGYNSYRDNFVTSVLDHFNYSGFSSGMSKSEASKTIWFPQTYNNIYGLLDIGDIIYFNNGSSGNRMVFSWGDSSFHPQGDNNMTITDSVIMGMIDGNTNFEIFSNFKDHYYYYNYSFIKVYKLEGKDQYNDDIMAFYVKPIGQDAFRLNYIPNLTNKSLYAIYYEGNNDIQPIIRKINADKTNDIMNDISFSVYKSKWNTNSLASANMRKHIGQSRQRKFRFFIADENGYVTNFSPELNPYVFRTGAKTKTMIRGL